MGRSSGHRRLDLAFPSGWDLVPWFADPAPHSLDAMMRWEEDGSPIRIGAVKRIAPLLPVILLVVWTLVRSLF